MPRRLSEEATRKKMIDPQLEKAGWYLRDRSRVKIEIPVDGYDAEPWNGVTDYTLYRENGEVLSVIEPTYTTIDARLAAPWQSRSQTQEELGALLRSCCDCGEGRSRESCEWWTRNKI